MEKNIEEKIVDILAIQSKLDQLELKIISLKSQQDTSRKKLSEAMIAISSDANDIRGNRKAINFDVGKISWKKASSIVAKNDDNTITELENLGEFGFITVKKSLNKRELLKNPKLVEKILDLNILTTEKMSINPAKSKS